MIKCIDIKTIDGWLNMYSIYTRGHTHYCLSLNSMYTIKRTPLPELLSGPTRSLHYISPAIAAVSIIVITYNIIIYNIHFVKCKNNIIHYIFYGYSILIWNRDVKNGWMQIMRMSSHLYIIMFGRRVVYFIPPGKNCKGTRFF